jgi:hypothetical protein
MEASGQLHSPAALPQGNDPTPGTHWIRGWVNPRAVLTRWWEKNSQPPPGIEPYNPDGPARSPVSIPTELSLLLRVCLESVKIVYVVSRNAGIIDILWDIIIYFEVSIEMC